MTQQDTQPPAGGSPMSINDVIRKARYGHNDWVAWTDRDGALQARRANREAVQAALLSIGTQGRWFIVAASSGHLHRHNFRDGCRMMRNAKHIWGRI